MKQIPLSQGMFALVDDEDYEFLNQWNWTAIKHRSTFYALRKIRLEDGTRKNVHLHRIILNAPDYMLVDHINGNALDNQKSNLRLATPRQNKINQKTRCNNLSGFTGVRYHKKNNKYIAFISTQEKHHVYLGSFTNIEDAVFVRKEAEKKYYGEFSRKEVHKTR